MSYSDPTRRFLWPSSSKARDCVLIVRLQDIGVISHQRPEMVAYSKPWPRRKDLNANWHNAKSASLNRRACPRSHETPPLDTPLAGHFALFGWRFRVAVSRFILRPDRSPASFGRASLAVSWRASSL